MGTCAIWFYFNFTIYSPKYRERWLVRWNESALARVASLAEIMPQPEKDYVGDECPEIIVFSPHIYKETHLWPKWWCSNICTPKSLDSDAVSVRRVRNGFSNFSFSTYSCISLHCGKYVCWLGVVLRVFETSGVSCKPDARRSVTLPTSPGWGSTQRPAGQAHPECE